MEKNKFSSFPSPNIEIFLFGICFAVFCLLKLNTDFSFSLDTLNNLILSQATSDGVDINLRVNSFYNYIFLGILFSFIGIFSMSKLTSFFKIELTGRSELLLFFVTYLCLSFFYSMGIDTRITIDIIEVIIVLRLIIIFFSQRDFFISKTISFAFQLSCSFILVFLILFLFGNVSWLPTKISLLLLLNFFIINILEYIFFKTGATKINIKLLLAPICFIPWLAFLAVESNFFYQKITGEFFGYKVLFLIFFSITSLIYFLLKTKVQNELIKKDRLLITSLIMAYALLRSYSPIMDYTNEMFELANPCNSILNVFKFDKIPFVDFSSSHMLYEQWYGYLYNLIFGFDGSLDFLTFGFFNDFIFLITAVYFFSKVFKSKFLSVFFCCFFPFLNELLFAPIFLAILPFLLLEKVIKEKNILSFFLLFSVLTSLLFWRIDTGAAALFSVTIITPVLYFCSKEKFPYSIFFKSMGMFLLCTTFLFSLILIFRSPSQIIENLQLSLHYFSANQAHGYSSIFIKSHQFYIYYILFPAISVFISIWVVLELRGKKLSEIFKEEFILLSSLFLFILFLSNAQRGLVRHTFIEQTELYFASTFFIALTLFISSFYNKKFPKRNTAFVYLCSFVLFISLKYFIFLPEKTKFENGLENSTFSRLGSELNTNFRHRVKINQNFKDNQLNDLKLFLDSTLTNEQTFLDFSNTPMLYFFTQRRVPGYFNQNLQNTVDDFMQFSLINKIDLEDVPIVILSNDPPNWFDMTDGIHNTIRYFLISEFIHKNYTPYKTISQKSIWVSKKLVDKLTPYKYDFIPYETINLKFLPFYNAKYILDNQPEKVLKKIHSYDVQLTDEINDSILSISSHILNENHLYVAFKFEDSLPEEKHFQFELSSESHSHKLTVEFSRLDSKLQTYFVRLSNHSIWHLDEPLFIHLPNHSDLNQITFFKDIRNED